MRAQRTLGIGWTVALGLLLSRPAAGAEPGDLLWAARAGGLMTDHGESIASFADGSIVVVGYCQPGAVFGPGEANETTFPLGDRGFVARYTSQGTLAWVKEIRGHAMPQAVAVFPTGSIVVVGDYSNALFAPGEANETLLPGFGSFLALYDSNGALAWARDSGVPNAPFASGVAPLDSGGFFVVGHTRVVPFGEITHSSAFVARYDGAGSRLWLKTADSPGSDFAHDVACFPDGSVVVTGSYHCAQYEGIWFGPAEWPALSFLQSIGGTDIFVARYSPDGALVWNVANGGTSNDRGTGIATLPDGSIVVVGAYSGEARFGPGPFGVTPTSVAILRTSGDEDIFVARFTGAGGLAWAKRAGGAQQDHASDVAVLPDGSLAVGGRFSCVHFGSGATFGPGESNQTVLQSVGSNAFVAVYEETGALAWVRHATGGSSEPVGGIAALPDGSLAATGSFGREAIFNPGEDSSVTLVGSGSGDIFVARYAGPRQIAAPVTIVQECDESADGATVNLTFDVLAGFSDLLRVRDETGGRTLLELAHPEDGPHGVGPIAFPHGTSTVVIELSASGAVLASATVTVLVEDTVPPQITGSSVATIELEGPLTTLTRSLLGLAVADVCDPAPTLTFAPEAVPLGVNAVRAIARDATGNTEVLDMEIAVVDTTPPVFTVVPDDIEQECRDPRGTKVSFDVLAEDLSGPVEITCTDQDGQPIPRFEPLFHPGVHTVTCTAADPSGNTASCSFVVTILDHHAPVILVPDDITVPAEPGAAFAFVEFTVTATDDCDPDSVLSVRAPWGPVKSGVAFPVGTTTVVCTALDRSGNEATASFRVTVEDKEPPILVVPKSVTIVMDGSCSECAGSKSCRCGRCDARRHGKRRRSAKRGDDATVALTASNLGVEVTDNSDMTPTVEISPPAVGPGRYEVTVTATDDDGNRATAFLPVLVVKPPLECQILRPLDGNVDNRIRAGRVVPIRLKVTCDNVAVRDATVTIDEIVQLDREPTPIANEAPDEDLEPEGAFGVRGDRYHMNLRTDGFEGGGARYEVLIRVQRAGHADAFCSVRFVVR